MFGFPKKSVSHSRHEMIKFEHNSAKSMNFWVFSEFRHLCLVWETLFLGNLNRLKHSGLRRSISAPAPAQNSSILRYFGRKNRMFIDFLLFESFENRSKFSVICSLIFFKDFEFSGKISSYSRRPWRKNKISSIQLRTGRGKNCKFLVNFQIRKQGQLVSIITFRNRRGFGPAFVEIQI